MHLVEADETVEFIGKVLRLVPDSLVPFWAMATQLDPADFRGFLGFKTLPQNDGFPVLNLSTTGSNGTSVYPGGQGGVLVCSNSFGSIYSSLPAGVATPQQQITLRQLDMNGLGNCAQPGYYFQYASDSSWATITA